MLGSESCCEWAKKSLGLLVCGNGGFSLRNLWVFRCNAMLCCWFVVGLIEEELVEEEGRKDGRAL